MTLDLDFANVQAYPPKSHPGIVVFRPESQDKPTLVALLKRLVPVLLQLSPKHQLWMSSRTGIAKNDTPRPGTSILIRARSVVQVHPGPPFKSPVNTRLFAPFPFRVVTLEKPFANYLTTFRANQIPPPSRALLAAQAL